MKWHLSFLPIIVSKHVLFAVNVMDLDDLRLEASPQPIPISHKSKKKQKKKGKKEKEKKEKKSKKKSNDFFSGLGLQSVDDLLGGSDVEVVSEVSEVLEEGRDFGVSISDIHNEDEIITPLRSILSPTPRSLATPRSARGRVRLSLGDVTEIRSRSPSPDPISTARVDTVAYSEDFDDETEAVKTVYSEDEDSTTESVSERTVTETESVLSSPSRSPRSPQPRGSRRRSSDYGGYSEDFTSTTETETQAYSDGSYTDDDTYTQSYATATDRSR